MPPILLTQEFSVLRAASYGMYVILDMHQDCLTSACGAYDGVPLWLIERLPRPPRELAFPWPFSDAPPQSSWYDYLNLNLNLKAQPDAQITFIISTRTSTRERLRKQLARTRLAGGTYISRTRTRTTGNACTATSRRPCRTGRASGVWWPPSSARARTCWATSS